jgi:hypothetical protein
MSGRSNRNGAILRVLTEMNAQTSVVSMINKYGVVIPLPRSLVGRLPNFVKLMDPLTNWDDTESVCNHYENKAYSNVSKLVRIVCWTCLHTAQNTSLSLPFGFYYSERKVVEFFGSSALQNPDGTRGRLWQCIEDPAAAEHVLSPTFVMNGDHMGLLELLDAILSSKTSQTWSNWDKLLGKFPEDGLGNFCFKARKVAGILIVSPEKRGKRYQAMAVNLGYLSDTAPDIGDAPTSRKHSMKNSENNKARKQKTTSKKNRNKKTDDDDDATKKGNPKDDSNADEAEVSSQEDGGKAASDEVSSQDRGGFQLVCESVLDSIPESDWKATDPEAFSLELHRSAKNHIHKAMVELALGILVTKQGIIHPKDSLKRVFQNITDPVFDNMDNGLPKKMCDATETWMESFDYSLLEDQTDDDDETKNAKESSKKDDEDENKDGDDDDKQIEQGSDHLEADDDDDDNDDEQKQKTRSAKESAKKDDEDENKDGDLEADDDDEDEDVQKEKPKRKIQDSSEDEDDNDDDEQKRQAIITQLVAVASKKTSKQKNAASHIVGESSAGEEETAKKGKLNKKRKARSIVSSITQPEPTSQKKPSPNKRVGFGGAKGRTSMNGP